MSLEKSLEGWVPEIGEKMSLARVVELAFDYRGNTLIIKNDSSDVVGYIFNRDAESPQPFIQYFSENGDGPFTLLYSEIKNIKFSGKDTASGKSWEAWSKRRDKARAKHQGQTAET
jgi:hypothetical protein